MEQYEDYNLTKEDEAILRKSKLFCADVCETNSDYEQRNELNYYLIKASSYDEAYKLFEAQCYDDYYFCTFNISKEINVDKLIKFIEEEPDEGEYLVDIIKEFDEEDKIKYLGCGSDSNIYYEFQDCVNY